MKYLGYVLIDLLPILVICLVLAILLACIGMCATEKLLQDIFEAYLGKLRSFFKIKSNQDGATELQAIAEASSEQYSLLTGSSRERHRVKKFVFAISLFFLIFPAVGTTIALYWDALIIKVDRGKCNGDTEYDCFPAVDGVDKLSTDNLNRQPTNCSDITEAVANSHKFVCYALGFDLGQASVQSVSFLGTYIVIVSVAAEILMFADSFLKMCHCGCCRCGCCRLPAVRWGVILAGQVPFILLSLAVMISLLVYPSTQQYFLQDIVKVFELVGFTFTLCAAAGVPWYYIVGQMPTENK